jgi:hypothetical protein
MSLQHLFNKNLDELCGCGHPLWRHEDEETFGDGCTACLVATCACRAFHKPEED